MNIKRLIIASVLCVSEASGLSIYATYPFKNESKFATGKWVKIEIGQTGLYQIPYTQLREMGFDDPSSVGVYGRGGKMLSVNFTNQGDGTPYNDDVRQIAVIHENGSLYFYGRGVEDINFKSGSAPHFSRGQLNLYSDTGYYFLSDRETPVIAQESTCGENATTLTSGWDYIYHEKDLCQNTTGTGQLFWGESFLDGEPSKSWNVRAPYLSSGTARLAYRLYTSPSAKGSVTLNIEEAGSPCTVPYSFINADRFNTIPSNTYDPPVEFEIKTDENITVSIGAETNDADFLNLDYWLLSYPKNLPGTSLLKDNPAETYAFPTNTGTSYCMTLNNNLRLIDTTAPEDITLGKRDGNNPDMIGFSATSQNTSVIIYDPSLEQLHIKSWKPVDNINLHALQTEGAELLIITAPRFRAYAERIAGLHRSYEGIAVAVATPEEIYNEFSAGTPDPMAYRAIARMLFQSTGSRLKNILLLGPSDRNLRHNVKNETKFDRIIAMQQASVTPDRDASPAYDFYGIMADAVNESSLYHETMEVGIGLLSCETENECERAIRKIEGYLADDTQAWRVNETLSIGGLHDNHTHDKQAEDFGNYIRNYTGLEGMAHTTIAVDAYGNNEARHRLESTLDAGKVFSVWFGHGAAAMLGRDKNFFTTSEAVNLKNRHLGFMFMGGCDFSEPDIRSRGLGESIVLDAERGMAAAIVSTRTAWSNQNYDLGKRIVAGWLTPADKNVSPTIGQIYASAKSKSASMNSLTYILSGDPALKVPTPLRQVKMTASESVAAGEKIKIEGTVTDKNGGTDNSFNGKAVLKLMEPSVVLRSKDYVTNTASTPVKETVNGEETTVYYTLDVTYDTSLMSALETEVTEGRFSAEIVIPENATTFVGQDLKLHAGVFDKSRWLGGAGAIMLNVSGSPSDESVTDMEAPSISAAYDNSRQMIAVTASDETALSLSPSSYEATLDGKPVTLYSEFYYETGDTGKSFEGYADISEVKEGTHSFSIKARDLAGNSVTYGIDFEKQPRKAPLALNISTKAAVDEIVISVEGDFSGALEYEIWDSDGKTVFSHTATSSSAAWNCRDTKGNKVASGLYRVRVRSAAGSSPMKYSEWETFAVFD